MTKHCGELPLLTVAVDSAACLGCWERQSWQPGRGCSGASTSCLQLSPGAARPGWCCRAAGLRVGQVALVGHCRVPAVLPHWPGQSCPANSSGRHQTGSLLPITKCPRRQRGALQCEHIPAVSQRCLPQGQSSSSLRARTGTAGTEGTERQGKPSLVPKEKCPSSRSRTCGSLWPSALSSQARLSGRAQRRARSRDPLRRDAFPMT